MKLDRSHICLSVNEDNRGYFKLLNSIRPNDVSFSQFVGVASSEYYEHHKEGEMKITDFTNKDVLVIPNYHAELEIWKRYITKMPTSNIKAFQRRHQQLGNLINKRVQEIIG